MRLKQTMRKLLIFLLLLLASASFAQFVAPQLSSKDAIRIHEFYNLVPQIAEQVWPNWIKTPAPLLLITEETEFLTHYAPHLETSRKSLMISTPVRVTFPPACRRLSRPSGRLQSL